MSFEARFCGQTASIRIRNLGPELSRLGPNDVRVRMLYSPINPADLLVLERDYPHPIANDAVLGAEGVGQVVEIGSDVLNLSVDDLVLPLMRGNWASHRIVQTNDVIKVPVGLSLEQAATLRINPATAWRLIANSGAKAGDRIIQNGARSMVAEYVRIFARELGVDTINLVRELPENSVSGLWFVDGADISFSESKPVAALDCVAGDASGHLARLLAKSARLLVFGHLSGQPCSIPSILLTGQNLTVQGFSLRPDEAGESHAELQALYDRLGAIISKDGYSPLIREQFPLTSIHEALAVARAPGRGRVLLDCSQ